MALSEQEKEAILKMAIEEQRRTFDHISNIFDQLRIKALTMMGGEVAIVAFLFASGLKMPDVIYGQVFFWAGIAFLSLAFASLLYAISPLQWKIPIEMSDIADPDDRWRSFERFLEYVRDEYTKCIEHCNKHVSLRSRRFNYTIYMLSSGVIIILLIRYGG